MRCGLSWDDEGKVLHHSDRSSHAGVYENEHSLLDSHGGYGERMAVLLSDKRRDLTGTLMSAPAAANLTSDGTLDWANWGLTRRNRDTG